MKSINQTSKALAKQAPHAFMYKVIAVRTVPSTYCFCRLFLENITPMRPTTAKPTPAMLTAVMASLTWSLRETP